MSTAILDQVIELLAEFFGELDRFSARWHSGR